MNKNWIFGLLLVTLFIVGITNSFSNKNENTVKTTDINNTPIIPARELDNGECLYKAILGEELRISSHYKDVIPLFFYFDINAPREMQLQQNYYKKLENENFKVVKTGLSSNPYVFDDDFHIKNDEIKEKYDLSVYSRNTRLSTKIITSSCYVYYMTNDIDKENAFEIITHRDESKLTDEELIKLFNKDLMHLVNFKTKKEFDKFKRETTITSEPYQDIILYGKVKEQYRSKKNQLIDRIMNGDNEFNKNDKLIEYIGVYITITKKISQSPLLETLRIYDTNGNIHEFISSWPEFSKNESTNEDLVSQNFLIKFSREFLSEHSSGFELKIESDEYNNIILIPDTMSKSFLNALDSI